jgi:hypothetical protein
MIINAPIVQANGVKFMPARTRATATATDKPTNADHLAVVLITDGTTTALDFDIAANGLQVTYYNDSTEEVAVTGNFLNGDLTEMQPGQAFIFFHVGGGSWIFK